MQGHLSGYPIMIDSALSAMKLEVGNKGVRMSRDLDGKESIELL